MFHKLTEYIYIHYTNFILGKQFHYTALKISIDSPGSMIKLAWLIFRRELPYKNFKSLFPE